MGLPIRRRISIINTDKSITDQSQKNAVDINRIVADLHRGVQTNNINQEPVYGDISDMPASLADSLNTIVKVQSDFDVLPVELKQLISNDWTRYEELHTNPALQQQVKKYFKKDVPVNQNSKNPNTTIKTTQTDSTVSNTGTPS